MNLGRNYVASVQRFTLSGWAAAAATVKDFVYMFDRYTLQTFG